MTDELKFSRLKSQLVMSKIQQQNPALYQVIDQLIDYMTRFQTVTNVSIASAAVDTTLRNSDILTWSDESGILPNSRNLLAGANISFNDAIANKRTIKGNNQELLTDGDLICPELIFADGEIIMVSIPA